MRFFVSSMSKFFHEQRNKLFGGLKVYYRKRYTLTIMRKIFGDWNDARRHAEEKRHKEMQERLQRVEDRCKEMEERLPREEKLRQEEQERLREEERRRRQAINLSARAVFIFKCVRRTK